MIKFNKSYESRKYGKPSAAEGKVNGPLGTGDPTSHLTQRKLPGHIKVDHYNTVPHTRGSSH
jgi:hypothetical protein